MKDIIHSGIKGMHWGIRRYRNEDGTLTEEGKKRYGSGSNASALIDKYHGIRKSELESEKGITSSSKSIIDATSPILRNSGRRASEKKVMKDISSMSNKELQDYINRKSLEQNYARLKAGDIRTGRERIANILEFGGAALSITGSALTLAISINELQKLRMKE